MTAKKPHVDPSPDKNEELAAYEKLRQEVKKVLDQSIDAISAEKIAHAIEHAERVMKETGGHTQENINRLGKHLKKDLLSVFKTTEPPAKELTESIGGLFDLWRDKGGMILADLAQAVGEWSQQFGHKIDEMLRYRSGEMTYGGKFSCLHCGQILTMKKPGHLPPCPKCHKVEFRRA